MSIEERIEELRAKEAARLGYVPARPHQEKIEAKPLTKKYCCTLFELDGFKTNGKALFQKFPALNTEIGDSLPALEVVATACLILKALHKGHIPRLLRQAEQTEFYHQAKGRWS